MAQEEERIEWRPGIRLQWSDFRAKPKTRTQVAAVTASGISYAFSSHERNGFVEIDYSVVTHFYPDRSWYRPEAANPIILAHEQLHFDIAELFARKMRLAMSNTRFSRAAKKEVRRIYDQTLRELTDFQARYDRETDFSRNYEAQLRWNDSIRQALIDTN